MLQVRHALRYEMRENGANLRGSGIFLLALPRLQGLTDRFSSSLERHFPLAFYRRPDNL